MYHPLWSCKPCNSQWHVARQQNAFKVTNREKRSEGSKIAEGRMYNNRGEKVREEGREGVLD